MTYIVETSNNLLDRKEEREKEKALETEAWTIKYYTFVIYELLRIMYWSIASGSDLQYKKTLAYFGICQFTIHYEFAMFLLLGLSYKFNMD